MPLILRAVKGSKLTIPEMDGNLTYLVSTLSGSIIEVTGSSISAPNTSITASSFVGSGSGIIGVISSSYAATASYSTTLVASAANTDVGQIRFYNSANNTLASINNLTASLAATASSVTPLNQNVIITGSLTVSGSSTFTNIGSAVFTGSIITSGSNTLIGNTNLTGSVNISGSTLFIGTHILSGSNTITGNTVLSGSLIVSGSATFRNTIFIVTGSQFYTGSSVYIGNQTITGSLSLTSNGTGTGLFINGQKQFNYGQFSSTATQSGSADTAYSMTFNITDFSNGVTLVSGSRLTVSNTGLYNIQFSSQLHTTANQAVDFSIWFAMTGSNIANSNTDFSIEKIAGGGFSVAALNFLTQIASGSYVELKYSKTTLEGQLQAKGTQATPTRPATPSVIVTVTQVA